MFTKIDCFSMMHCQLHGFMKNGLFTDVIFNIGSSKLKAHKAILASSSPVFQAMFETGLEETRSNEVVLVDVEEDVFSAFLDYIYIRDVKFVEKHVRQMVMLADKYDVEPLLVLCDKLIETYLDEKNAVDYFLLANTYRRTNLKVKVVAYIKERLETLMASDSWLKLEEDFDVASSLIRNICIDNSVNEVTWTLKSMESWFGLSSVEPEVQLYDNHEPIVCGVSLGSVNCSLFVEVLVINPRNEPVWSVLDIQCVWSRSHTKSESLLTMYCDSLYNGTGKYYLPVNAMSSHHYPLSITVALNCHPINRHPYLKKVVDRDERFTDAILVASNVKFLVHKLVLAGKSDFFSELFETDQIEYKIDGMSSGVMNILVEYLYYDRIPPPEKLDLDLLRGAKLFKLDWLVDHCVTVLKRNITCKNAIELCTTADELGLKELESAVLDFIGKQPINVVDFDNWATMKNNQRLLRTILLTVNNKVTKY